MVKQKKKVPKDEDLTDIDEFIDEDIVRSTVLFPREDVKRLKIESAEKGTTMSNILRGILRNHLDSDVDDEARDRVEDHLDDILNSCERWVGNFKIDKFVEKMSDNDISLSDLNRVEWRSVLDKLEEGGLSGSITASEFRDKFSDLNPSHSQRRDLRQLARKLIKKKKEGIW